jgi:hypothetical protein
VSSIAMVWRRAIARHVSGGQAQAQAPDEHACLLGCHRRKACLSGINACSKFGTVAGGSKPRSHPSLDDAPDEVYRTSSNSRLPST